MDPVTIGLIATSALGKLGSIFGQRKRKQLDPEMLKKMFGAKAVTDEQMELFNRAMGSAQGQQLMTSAAQEGQQFQTDVARRAGEAGLGPAGGATGGADIFAGAASQSAVGNLQRGVRSNMMTAMLPIARSMVNDRMQAWLSDRERYLNQTPMFQDVMTGIGGLGADLLASRSAAQTSPDQGGGAADPTSGNWMNTPSYVGYQDFAPPSLPPSAAAPAGTLPSAGAPPGAQPRAMAPAAPMMTGAQAQQTVPGARGNQMRMALSGGGRFARSMAGLNRFGAVQPAYGAVG